MPPARRLRPAAYPIGREVNRHTGHAFGVSPQSGDGPQQRVLRLSPSRLKYSVVFYTGLPGGCILVVAKSRLRGSGA
jgi:hypothetical protein